MDLFNKLYNNDQMYYGLHVFYKFNEFCKGLTGSALDIGCGEGRYSIYLAKNGLYVTAFDKSKIAIRKLIKLKTDYNLNINAMHLDIKKFNFQKNSYDLLVASTVLEQLNESERVFAVKGIKESLKVGGLLYVGVFNTDDPGYLYRYSNENSNVYSECASTIHSYYGVGELKSQFTEFEILYYSETYELDESHGEPHHHGISRLIARKKEA